LRKDAFENKEVEMFINSFEIKERLGSLHTVHLHDPKYGF